MHPSISANGELVYVNAQIRQDVYETQTGNADDARRLTSFGTVSSFRLSGNGRVLLFSASRQGNSDVWKRDLVSGAEQIVAASSANEMAAGLNADGSRVFLTIDGDLFMVDGSKQMAEPVCKGCALLDVDAAGKIIWIASRAGGAEALDVETGIKTPFIDAGAGQVHSLRRSFDGRRWAVSVRTSQGFGVFAFATPISGSVDRATWVPVDYVNNSPPIVAWHANGNSVLYTAMLRDSFNCVWATDVDVEQGRSSRSRAAVHAHTPQPTGGIRSFDSSASRVVFALAEGRSNIWMQTVK
jgi:hypothetical protein